MTGTVLDSMSAPFLIFFAVLFGATFGSFASVLVHRVPVKMSLMTRSQCTSCGHQIGAWENIPVLSFIALHGKCRSCGSKFSWSYPALEVGMAVLFAIAPLVFHSWTAVLLWISLSIFGLPLFLIDVKLHRLPDLLTGALFFASALIIICSAFAHHHFNRLVPSFVGALALATYYFAIVVVSRGGMGMGDVKLSASVGLISGYFGLHAVLVSSYTAFALGSLIGVALIVLGKAGRKTAIPFGPFIIVGQMISLLVLSHLGS